MLEERLAASLGDLRGVRAGEKLDDKEVLLVGDAFHWENVFGCGQEHVLKIVYPLAKQVFDEQFFRHSFLYPDITDQPDDLRLFIEGDIIEKSHKHTLEKSGRLNWWASTGKLPILQPLATSGDGNCLLHAASLYMWGLPDRDLILRTHLHRLLTTGVEKDSIKRRWRYLTNLRNQEAGGLVFSEEEWEFEWSEILRIATNQPRRRPTTDSLKRYSTIRSTSYESLEEVHVFAMAHVLSRPIIVVADDFIRDARGDPFAPIYFGGIYLPLERAPSSCYKSPLILAFGSAHFSPLVAKRDPQTTQKKQKSRLRHLPSKQDTVMPLVTPDGSLLPLPFIYDPKKKNVSERWANEKCELGDFPDELRTLIESYLDIRWIQLNIGSTFENTAAQEEDSGDKEFQFPVKVPKFRFPAAVVSSLGEPEYQSVLVVNYLEDVQKRFMAEKERLEKMEAEKARQEEEFKRLQATRPVPCQGKGCSMFGTASTDNLCSKCYSKKQKKAERNKSDPDDSKVSFPEKWEIVLPDIVANVDSSHEEPPPDSGVQLISQSNIEHTDSDNLPENQQPSPTDSPTKSGFKLFTKSPPKSPPKTPPKSPPKKTPLKPPSKAPPKPPPNKPQPKPVPISSNSSTHVPKQKGQAPPPPARPTGYSRDHIKPLSYSGAGGRVKCIEEGCDFFGSQEHEGLCSQCYKRKNPSITQV